MIIINHIVRHLIDIYLIDLSHTNYFINLNLIMNVVVFVNGLNETLKNIHCLPAINIVL